MYLDFIKYYVIFLFSIYISMMLLSQRKISLTLNIFVFVFTFIIAIISTIFYLNLAAVSHLVSLLLLWIFMSIYTARPQIAFIVVTLSFGISYGIHAFSSLISTTIVYILLQSKDNFAFWAVSLLATLLHTLISLALLQEKRLRNGLPLTHSTNYINISTLFCLLFITLPTYSPTSSDPLWQKTFFLIALPSILAFLIYWWQAQITKSYRRSLELRELESLRTADIEKDILIQKLFKENERLATITHRDNTLITTLKNSTVNYLMTDFEDPEEAKAVRDKLVAHIESLSEGRTSLPPDYREKKARDFNTSISILDEMLHHMDETAIEKNITFSVHLGTELVDFVPQNISESDLVHTVDDLLKNAFKSTLTCEKRAVQLQFYKLGKHFVVEVADNGIPFEVRSLVNMGIEKLTTYEDGSGIGLMDIWNTKEKYGATYHLEEYAAPAPFSKKISLTFDKKNRYSIRTWRKDEILQMSKRADLQVYDYEE